MDVVKTLNIPYITNIILPQNAEPNTCHKGTNKNDSNIFLFKTSQNLPQNPYKEAKRVRKVSS